MRDALNNEVHENRRLVRFTEYDPAHQTEAFFFNVLLRKLAFRNESQLISPENHTFSYFMECKLQGVVAEDEDLEMYINEYTQRNLLVSEQTSLNKQVTL